MQATRCGLNLLYELQGFRVNRYTAYILNEAGTLSIIRESIKRCHLGIAQIKPLPHSEWSSDLARETPVPQSLSQL
jgi:hypothetical protein